MGGSATQDEEVPHNTFGADIAARYRHFFNPTTPEDRRFIAQHAYVPSVRRHQYVEPIDRIIRSAVPPSLTGFRALENSAQPTPVIKAIKDAHKWAGQVMLLIGSVGSGKTTFIDYLQEVALPTELKAGTVWVHANMNEAPINDKLIYEWVINCIVKSLQDSNPHLNFDELDAWKLVFAAELNRLTNTVLKMLPADAPSRSERLANELGRLMADQGLVANGLIRYLCVEAGKAFILVLDNCDKRTLQEQLLMFQVAQWAKSTFRCVVFLPLRDVTYDLYRTRPPLDTALKDLVFHIEAPMFSKVLANRIRLALSAMDKEQGQKRLTFVLKSGVEVEYPASDRAMYLVAITKSMFDYDRIVRRLITALAGRDVRRAMELFLEFCTSGHITENDIWRIKEANGKYTLPYDVVVRVLLRMNRRFYNGDKAYISNIVQCNPKDPYPDHFIRAAILRWLQAKFSLPGPTNVNGYHAARNLISDLILHGHEASRCRREIHYLVRGGCVVTEHQDKDQISDDDLITISPAGWVHIDLLANSDYLAACAEDTWMSDQARAQKIAELIGRRGEYGHYKPSPVAANARALVDFLEEESQRWFKRPELFAEGQHSDYLHTLEPLRTALKSPMAAQDADAVVETFGRLVRVGDHFDGQVVSVKPFGAFIRLFDRIDGLLHVSKYRTDDAGVPQLPEVGQLVDAKVIRIDLNRKQIEVDLRPESPNSAPGSATKHGA